MKKSNNLLLGKKGEDIAADYLVRHGYTIVERNFRKRYGDIDIIAQKGDVLVFVEVKTRTSDLYGRGEEAISRVKIHHLTRSAQYYKHVKNLKDTPMQIDLISIYLDYDGETNKINHYENITG